MTLIGAMVTVVLTFAAICVLAFAITFLHAFVQRLREDWTNPWGLRPRATRIGPPRPRPKCKPLLRGYTTPPERNVPRTPPPPPPAPPIPLTLTIRIEEARK